MKLIFESPAPKKILQKRHNAHIQHKGALYFTLIIETRATISSNMPIDNLKYLIISLVFT